MVLQRFGNPNAITIGSLYDDYYALMLDYGKWGVEYTGAKSTAGNTQGKRCPLVQNPSAFLWVYSSNEVSLFKLIKSVLSKDPYVHDVFPFTILQKVQTETYITDASIATFLGDLKTNGCF